MGGGAAARARDRHLQRSLRALDGGRASSRRADRHLELDPEHATVAQHWFDRSPHGDRITLHLGPALESLGGLDGDFDFVFLDADKDGYIDYYEAVLPRLAERGLIVADNTLWSGRVLDDADGPIARFNEHVAQDRRSIAVILPVRDGMTLIRRA